jgi:hypothetical protein
MRSALQKTTLIASTALSLSFVAYSAQAFPTLPGLPNLNFTQYNGVAPKTLFTVVQPVGWTGGGSLVSIDAPGTATQDNQSHGNAYAVYKDPGPVPNKGNFVQADGNPSYESSFNYQLTGLTNGTKYLVGHIGAYG